MNICAFFGVKTRVFPLNSLPDKVQKNLKKEGVSDFDTWKNFFWNLLVDGGMFGVVQSFFT